jgi:hypothetical protein
MTEGASMPEDASMGETAMPPPKSQTSALASFFEFRLNLKTAMLLVLVAGLGSATWVKTMMFFPRSEPLVIDGPTIFVMAIALCGAAIAGIRKYSGHQYLGHVAMAYCVVACTVLLAEIHQRAATYWLQFVVGTSIAIPFAVQGYRLRRGLTHACQKRELKKWVEAVVLSNFNIVLAIIGVFLSISGAQMLTEVVKNWRATGG